MGTQFAAWDGPAPLTAAAVDSADVSRKGGVRRLAYCVGIMMWAYGVSGYIT